MIATTSRPQTGHGRWSTGALTRLAHELAAFGVVGGVAFVVDVSLFNLLRFHTGSPLTGKPLTDKIVSASVATLVSWVGNRWWTYRGQRRDALGRELGLFAVMNGLALLLAVGCLGVSHYVLGLHSAVADNISGNFVGVALGTAFRFVAYRWWVFRPQGVEPVADLATEPVGPATEPVVDLAAEPVAGAGRTSRVHDAV